MADANLNLFPDQQGDEPSSGKKRKSERAYRTISEVAEELGVATHVLRFWESKFPALKPMKRAGGRRYYRPEDVELLRRIRSLLYDEGYTIKGVQAYLKRGGPGKDVEIEQNPDLAMLSQALQELQRIRAVLRNAV